MEQKNSLTNGNITQALLLFALPMMAGNLLQQCYNIADTLIVGQFLGKEALAAVGSAYTLMTFLTSILLGLCMGNGVFVSICFGKGEEDRLKKGVFLSFLLIFGVSAVLNIGVFVLMEPILTFLNIPEEVRGLMRSYLEIIFCGMTAVFLYNYFTCLLRGIGNSVVPLLFLLASTVLNIVLDLLFILKFGMGVAGAALATVIAQYLSGIGVMLYAFFRCRTFALRRRDMGWDSGIVSEISQLSVLTCLQQSVMNFGILMVQGLVNSFGTVVMAAFAAAVKIDSFAYMPVQDFGNAFSTFTAQNFGAGKQERIEQGIRKALLLVTVFCLAISAFVCIFARELMLIFIKPEETEVLRVGIGYLRMEGSFYIGIGFLFLLYGFYRAVKRPGMSLVLTVISLGVRVALAYATAGTLGVSGIWMAIPIGWFLADLVGYLYYRHLKKLGTVFLVQQESGRTKRIGR